MARKEANTDIRCSVESCGHHCGEQNFCSLRSIRVEHCENCGSGIAADESMCASYKKA